MSNLSLNLCAWLSLGQMTTKNEVNITEVSSTRSELPTVEIRQPKLKDTELQQNFQERTRQYRNVLEYKRWV